jgi:hypothetical protein
MGVMPLAFLYFLEVVMYKVVSIIYRTGAAISTAVVVVQCNGRRYY